MTKSPSGDLVAELTDLLDREMHALRAGELDSVMRLSQQKETLIDALNDAAPERDPGLRQLQQKMLRNQGLLEGTLQGIREVAGRIAALRRVRRTLETYDSTGRKCTIDGDTTHKMRKRA